MAKFSEQITAAFDAFKADVSAKLADCAASVKAGMSQAEADAVLADIAEAKAAVDAGSLTGAPATPAAPAAPSAAPYSVEVGGALPSDADLKGKGFATGDQKLTSKDGKTYTVIHAGESFDSAKWNATGTIG